MPGDLLDIEVLDIAPGTYGWTAILPGFTFLADRFPDPFVVHWDLRDGVATSADLPGVAIRGAPFLGTMLVAPSHDELEVFRARERELAESGAVVPLPDPQFAVPSGEPLAREALRLVPPRENGGNMDVRQLTAGSVLTLQVRVPGALFSCGDPHFTQGEGESGGSAIETTARACLRFGVRKRKHVRWVPPTPVLRFSECGRPYFMTTGISVTEDGQNLDMDFRSATRGALTAMIEYLVYERGYSEQQADILTGAVVDLRQSEVVNPPNVLVGAVLPLDIFSDGGRFTAAKPPTRK
jgi:formamidase